MSESETRSVQIERTFDAPIGLVWQMWTDPDHFASWYGPMGATIPTCTMDVQVGGKRHFCMAIETPNGPMQMWFTGEYKEIVENERLVYTESMSDEAGNVKSPAEIGMPEGHPTTTDVVVELLDLGGKTQMTMTHIGVPAESPGAAGWEMAFDKLATYIESVTA